MGEGGPEAGRPDDGVERLLASVGPPGAVLGQPLDHRPGDQVAAVAGRAGGGAEQVRGDLGAGVAAPDHQHPLPGEGLRPAVVVHVQLGPAEDLHARHPRPEGLLPRAGGGDHGPGGEVASVGHDPQARPRALDRGDLHRPADVDVVALLVVGQVVHDVRRVGRLVTRRTRHQSAGQRAVAGGGEEPQARPGVLPRAPGRRAGVEQHHRQRGAGAPALGPAQVEGERQRGLPAADDADVDGLRQGPAQGPGRRPAQQHVLRRSISTVSRHSPSSWAMRERTASVT